MQQLDSSSLKLYREADGSVWLNIGRLLSLNLTALANDKGPIWLFQFKKWSKELKAKEGV